MVARSRRRQRKLHPIGVLDAIELSSALEDSGIKPVHARAVQQTVVRAAKCAPVQLHHAFEDFVQGVRTASLNHPRALAGVLDDYFTAMTTKVVKHVPNSIEGTGAKLEVELQDGLRVETVIIEHVDTRTKGGPRRRSTVCVSSQVGCKMGCTFCATGTMGLVSHLTAGEICEQVLHAVHYASRDAPVRNVVFMGMGEPLDNYENVLAAVRTMNRQHAFNIALKRITVSTVGVVGAIERLAADCPDVNLALSLHAPTQETRLRIVPSGSAYPIERIIGAIDHHGDLTGRKVMIEYILIDGVNASVEHAHQLGQLLQGRRVTVNLIPYNPTGIGEKHGFRSPSEETCKAFQDTMLKYHGFDGRHIYTTLRRSSANGRSVEGACGQLVIKSIEDAKSASGAEEREAKQLQDIEDIGSTAGGTGAAKGRGRALPGRARTAIKGAGASEAKADTDFVASLLVGALLTALAGVLLLHLRDEPL